MLPARLVRDIPSLSDTELRIILVVIAHPDEPMSLATIQERTGRSRQVYDAVKVLERTGVLVRTIVEPSTWRWKTVYTDAPMPVPAPEPEAKPAKAKKAKPAVEKPPTIQQHPAVMVYTTVTNRRPSNVVAQQIADAVTDLGLWEQTVKSYILRGWNPLNVLGMLKMYRGEITPNTTRAGQGNGRGAPVITHSAPSKAKSDWERYLAENAEGGTDE